MLATNYIRHHYYVVSPLAKAVIRARTEVLHSLHSSELLRCPVFADFFRESPGFMDSLLLSMQVYMVMAYSRLASWTRYCCSRCKRDSIHGDGRGYRP